MTSYVLDLPVPATVPVEGTDALFPVHRIYCVGRNYAAHRREMGGDDRDPPFFFAKPADAVVPPGGVVPYPGRTTNLHHEIELVVAIGARGVDIGDAGRLRRRQPGAGGRYIGPRAFDKPDSRWFKQAHLRRIDPARHALVALGRQGHRIGIAARLFPGLFDGRVLAADAVFGNPVHAHVDRVGGVVPTAPEPVKVGAGSVFHGAEKVGRGRALEFPALGIFAEGEVEQFTSKHRLAQECQRGRRLGVGVRAELQGRGAGGYGGALEGQRRPARDFLRHVRGQFSRCAGDDLHAELLAELVAFGRLEDLHDLGVEALHAHAYVIDDHHRRWPMTSRP